MAWIRERPTLTVVGLLALYNLAVGTLLDFGENERFKFEVESLLWCLIAYGLGGRREAGPGQEAGARNRRAVSVEPRSDQRASRRRARARASARAFLANSPSLRVGSSLASARLAAAVSADSVSGSRASSVSSVSLSSTI